MKDPSIPQFVINPEVKITLQIPPTDAQVEDQGYTYNQAGITYNQAGVMYGGVFQTNQDVAPVFFNDTATLLNPSISGIIDIYQPFIPDPDKGMLIAPGLPWQFITYP